MRKQNHHEIYHGSLTCTHVLLFLYAVAHQLVIVYYVNTVMCLFLIFIFSSLQRVRC